MSKRKFHDPMKTNYYYTQQYGNGNDIVTYKEKSTKAMKKNLEATEQLVFNFFELSEEEQEKRYEKELAPVLSEFNAKYSAMFLIANNIARRGQPLHPDTAIKKLEKMRRAGSILAVTTKSKIDESFATNVHLSLNQKHNLHYFLYTYYGVTLMDKSLYGCVQDEIKEATSWGKYGLRDRRHYESFAKKFHASVINQKTHE